MDEHPGRAVRQPAAGIGVAAERLRFRIERESTAIVDVVEQQVGIAAGGKPEPEDRSTFAGCDLGTDAVVKIDAIQVRACNFVLAREGEGTSLAVRIGHAGGARRHDL